MKILFYDYNLPALIDQKNVIVGGATIQTSHWIRGLLAQGHDVGVLVEQPPRSRPPEEFDRLEFVPSFDLSRGIFPLNWIHYRYPALKRSIAAYDPDAIYHSGAGFTTWTMAKAARSLGIKIAYRIANDADVDSRIKIRLGPVRRWFYLQSLVLVDAILCQNAYQRRISTLAPEKPTFLVNKPFPEEHIPSQVVSQSDREYVAWIGRFVPQKNMGLLADVAESRPKLQFAVAGSSQGKLTRETLEAFERLRSLPNVRLVNYLNRSEVLPFLSRAHCLLNTSDYEGFSNTFLEAFAVGTPIVTSRQVDPDGIIMEHQLGRVSGSPDGLPNAIDEFLSLREKFDFTSRCRSYLTAAHGLQTQTRKIVEVFESVTSD